MSQLIRGGIVVVIAFLLLWGANALWGDLGLGPYGSLVYIVPGLIFLVVFLTRWDK